MGREHVDGAIGIVVLRELAQPRLIRLDLIYASAAKTIKAELGDANSVEKFAPANCWRAVGSALGTMEQNDGRQMPIPTAKSELTSQRHSNSAVFPCKNCSSIRVSDGTVNFSSG